MHCIVPHIPTRITQHPSSSETQQPKHCSSHNPYFSSVGRFDPSSFACDVVRCGGQQCIALTISAPRIRLILATAPLSSILRWSITMGESRGTSSRCCRSASREEELSTRATACIASERPGRASAHSWVSILTSCSTSPRAQCFAGALFYSEEGNAR